LQSVIQARDFKVCECIRQLRVMVAESYLSLWDLFWALVSPILALYLRDVDLQFDADWSAVVWLQDGMTRYFSVHEALDRTVHAYSSRRHSAFDTARPRITARGWAPRSQSLRAYHGQRRQ
jgi:hypothetical protein